MSRTIDETHQSPSIATVPWTTCCSVALPIDSATVNAIQGATNRSSATRTMVSLGQSNDWDRMVRTRVA